MNKYNIELIIQNFAINNCIDHYDYFNNMVIIKKRWINGNEFGIYLKFINE
jgi:hypothetical protein